MRIYIYLCTLLLGFQLLAAQNFDFTQTETKSFILTHYYLSIDEYNEYQLPFVNMLPNVAGYHENEGTIDYEFRLDAILSQDPIEGQNNWQTHYKDDFSYDGKGRLVNYRWLGVDTSGKSVPYYIFSYAYDDKDRLISETTVYYNSNFGNWVTEYRAKYIYTDSGINRIEFYTWQQNWIIESSIDFLLDEKGHIISEIHSYKGPEQWVQQDKRTYEYDNQGKIIFEMEYYWDIEMNDWCFYHFMEYRYNYKKLLSEVLHVDVYGDIYYTYCKELYSYNENNDVCNHMILMWDQEMVNFRPYHKNEFEYTKLNATSSITEYSWNISTQSWNPYYRTQLIYNNSYNKVDLLLPDFLFGEETLDLYFRKMPKQITWSYFALETEDWKNLGRYELVYSPRVPTGVDIISNEVELYPNPTSTKVNFSVGSNSAGELQMKVYDLLGREIENKSVHHEGEYDVMQLRPGIYKLIWLDKLDQVFSRTIVVLE